MSLISILQVDPIDWVAEFDVDNTLLEVPIFNSGPGAKAYAIAGKAASIVSTFIEGENIVIESIGIRVPHLFCMGSEEPTLIISAENATTTTFIYGPIEIPYFNAEIPVNIPYSFQDFSSAPGDTKLILNLVGAGTVSMLNVPDSIQGETVTVLPFIKLSHNFPLQP